MQHADGRTNPTTLHIQTDTASPQPVVAVYYLHSLQQPFCPHPSCVCRQHQAQISQLLMAIQGGDVSLLLATDFTDGETSTEV